jgi:N-methylhydantoinase A
MPVLRRSNLSAARAIPLIVEEPIIGEEYDATCLVPPGARSELDAGGNIVVEMG